MDSQRPRERGQVLSPARARDRISIGRVDAPQDLAWCLDYLWWVRWATPLTYTQHLIPRPVVHLSAEEREGECRIWVTGVTTELFARRLGGVGRTVGAAFRPGGMRPFTSWDIADLTDRVIPAQEVIGLDDRAIALRLLHDSLSEDDAARLLARWLASRAPIIDPRVDEVAALVERVEQDQTIVSVRHLTALAGVSQRTLQRRFHTYVGVGPKWVIQRHRLLDVAAAANAGGEVDWPELAARLGYSDQSHLIRHFHAVVGEPPAAYSRASASDAVCSDRGADGTRVPIA